MTGAATAGVGAAVERALRRRRADATREVEAILEAALRVAERQAPAAPRVAEIVAEAGSSNQAFYRYFASKDELMRAVFDRGVARLGSYLEHQMTKGEGPEARLEAWLRGVLRQVTDRRAARQSAAVIGQLGRVERRPDGHDPLADLRRLLVEPISGLGSEAPESDAALVFDLAFAVLNRHAAQGTAPPAGEVERLIAFCRHGLGRP